MKNEKKLVHWVSIPDSAALEQRAKERERWRESS